MRLDGMADYRPENITLIENQLSGYPIAQTLPYKAPAPPAPARKA
jgi:hypothetical protein